MQTCVLGPPWYTGERENSMRKLRRCPAAQPPVGQVEGAVRVSPSVEAFMLEENRKRNAPNRAMNRTIQISFRIGVHLPLDLSSLYHFGYNYFKEMAQLSRFNSIKAISVKLQ